MTSKNLFFKLVRQDFQRRIWCPVLIFIAYFLGMEVRLLMETEKYLKNTDRYFTDENFYDIITYVKLFFFGREAWLVSIVTCAVALLCGISGYAYLHSRTQIDMYHSLPVSRTQLFWSKYLSGILQFFLPFGIHTLICAGIAASRDGFVIETVPYMLSYVVLQLVVFVLVYGATVLAVVLTGNMIVSILGAGVFVSYSAIISMLAYLLSERFFQTYVTFGNRLGAWSDERVWCFSPLSMLLKLFVRPYNTTMEAAQAFYRYDTSYVWVLAAAAVVYSLAAYFVSLKRASEAAGKSIAFRVTEPVIKTMIVIPFSFFAALFFSTISPDDASDGWFLFGLVFSFVLLSVFMEIIFRLDIRGAWMHKKQFLFNAACTALIFIVLRYDVTGYDTYVPSDAQLQSCAVSIEELMPLVQNVRVSPFGFHHLRSNEYRMANMQLQGNPSVMELARKAAKQQLVYCYFDAYEELRENPENIEIIKRQEHYQLVSFGYHLRNGKTIYRRYYIDTADADTMRLLSDIFEDCAYKTGSTPLFNDNWDIAFDAVRCESNFKFKELGLTPDTQARLVETYQKEYMALTLDDIIHVIPVGTLDFVTKHENGRTSYSGKMIVYPQFVETIALLKEYGFDMEEKLTADDVKEIQVEKVYDASDYLSEDTAYQVTTSEAETVEYTDKEQIQQILDSVINSSYLWEISSFADYIDNQYDIRVIYHVEDGVSSYYRFVRGQIPDFVKISEKNN